MRGRAAIVEGSPVAAMSAPDDAALLERIAAADHMAFALLVRRHTPRYYALAYRSVFRREEAEDIVQEAFLKLWRNPRLWRKEGGAKFTTWFYRLVLNLCHDHNKRKRPSPLPEAFDAADDGENAEEALANTRRGAAVERALQRLPERQRVALNLCFHEGMSNQEAANVMGIRLKALQSLLMRAKTELKEQLKDYG